MNNEIEKRFAYTFLEKRIRDRIIFELASEEKRTTAIYRFSHTTEDIVKPSCIYRKTNDQQFVSSEIYNLIDSKNCYVISSNREVDGVKTTVEKAISACVGFGMPSIIILNESLVLIETEQCYGAADKYILHSK